MRKKNYDILDLYESYIVENYSIGKKNIRNIRNTIKRYGYDLFFKPIEKITEKNIKSCLESIDLIGKKKESKKLTVYLYILLNFAKKKSIIKNNPVSNILFKTKN